MGTCKITVTIENRDEIHDTVRNSCVFMLKDNDENSLDVAKDMLDRLSLDIRDCDYFEVVSN